MEKNCDIRKIINPNELVDVFYGFVIENEIYNKYQKKLKKSRRGELGNVTYLINEVSKAKTAEAYAKTPFYVLSFDDGEDFDYWIGDIMISWLSYLNEYLDSCNLKMKKIALLIRFLRENNITRKFKTKLMFEHSFYDDSECSLIYLLKNSIVHEIDITTIIKFESYDEYRFWGNIQEKWEKSAKILSYVERRR